jgi:AcrR family transcriptional regulator
MRIAPSGAIRLQFPVSHSKLIHMPRLKAAQRREQLIEVATRLFAKSGYEATTTAAIAEAAGVTEPILYRHFKSKQELFVAIVREVSRHTLEQWQALTANQSDPAEKLRVIAAALPEHMKRLSDYYHVLHGALGTSRDKKVVAVMREHYDQIQAFFNKIVTEGQKTGGFRKDLRPEAASWQFIFSGIGYAMIALNLGPMDKDMIKEVIDSMVRGIKG